MAYTPKTWECGDTITAEDLNHIEQGIANSGGGTEPLIVHVSFDESTGVITLDKTWKEIRDVFATGANVIIDRSEVLPIGTIDHFATVIAVDANPYEVRLGDLTYFIASLDSDYPSIHPGSGDNN